MTTLRSTSRRSAKPGSELFASTQAPAFDDLPNAWVDFGGEESLVSGDNSKTGFEPGVNLNQEIAAGELVANAGDELADIDETQDGPIVSFTEQDAVDNFFAELGNEFEFTSTFPLVSSLEPGLADYFGSKINKLANSVVRLSLSSTPT